MRKVTVCYGRHHNCRDALGKPRSEIIYLVASSTRARVVVPQKYGRNGLCLRRHGELRARVIRIGVGRGLVLVGPEGLEPLRPGPSHLNKLRTQRYLKHSAMIGSAAAILGRAFRRALLA